MTQGTDQRRIYVAQGTDQWCIGAFFKRLSEGSTSIKTR